MSNSLHNGSEYSTLEVVSGPPMAPFYAEHHTQQSPEINHAATKDRDYPEVNPGRYDGPYVVGEEETTPAKASRTCGMTRKVFITVIVISILAVIGIVVGVAVGVTQSKNSDSSPVATPTPTSSGESTNNLALLSNTRIASANFTDEWDFENYLVVYQLKSRAIYMSAYNSSTKEWIVSPVIDGSNGIGLDSVREGTHISLDIYYHNSTWRDVHLYWQSPTNAVKSLFRNSISTDVASTADDWSSPFSTDRYTAGNASAIASYGRQCVDCVLYTYVFFQDSGEGLYGGTLLHDNEDGWTDRNFSSIAAPAQNTSLALTSVAAQNGTDNGISLFYQAATGVLTQLTYDGLTTWSSAALPKGLSEDSTIVAFSTGYNGTDLGFQVLTTSPGADDGVQLTYQQDDSWSSGDEVTDLQDCVAKSSMAVNFGQRVYCVVETDSNDLEIVEWTWGGDVDEGSSTFTSWTKVGTVNTTAS